MLIFLGMSTISYFFINVYGFFCLFDFILFILTFGSRTNSIFNSLMADAHDISSHVFIFIKKKKKKQKLN
jgi:hypothetical protein